MLFFIFDNNLFYRNNNRIENMCSILCVCDNDYDYVCVFIVCPFWPFLYFCLSVRGVPETWIGSIATQTWYFASNVFVLYCIPHSFKSLVSPLRGVERILSKINPLLSVAVVYRPHHVGGQVQQPQDPQHRYQPNQGLWWYYFKFPHKCYLELCMCSESGTNNM